MNLAVIQAALRDRYQWPEGRALYASCPGPTCLDCVQRDYSRMVKRIESIQAVTQPINCELCKEVIE